MRKAATVVLATLFALPVAGRCATDDRISGPELVKILQDAGYRAKLDTDKDGDPMVRTGMNGLNVYIYSYDCEHHRCGSLQLSVGVDMKQGTAPAVINKFNIDYRYGRAYLDNDNDPFLLFDFEVRNTHHEQYIASQLDTWEDLLGAFTDAIGFRDGSKDPPAEPGHVLGARRDVAAQMASAQPSVSG
jgi:hypothetical protein